MACCVPRSYSICQPEELPELRPRMSGLECYQTPQRHTVPRYPPRPPDAPASSHDGAYGRKPHVLCREGGEGWPGSVAATRAAEHLSRNSTRASVSSPERHHSSRPFQQQRIISGWKKIQSHGFWDVKVNQFRYKRDVVNSVSWMSRLHVSRGLANPSCLLQEAGHILIWSADHPDPHLQVPRPRPTKEEDQRSKVPCSSGTSCL